MLKVRFYISKIKLSKKIKTIGKKKGCECVVHSECYYAECNNGECLYIEKTPTPPGCCTTSTQCTNGTVGGVSCISPNCFSDYYTCANIWNCGTSNFPPPPDVPCSDIPDCAYLANYCVNPVCTNGTCVLETTWEAGCCETTSQCMNVPCMTTYCDIALHYCVYVPVPNCVYNSITPSLSSSTSFSSTSSSSATATSSSTPTPSFSSTSTSTMTPSTSSTSTSTSTSSSTSTASATSTQSPIPSTSSTNTGTTTATPSTSYSSSASFSITPSASGSPHPTHSDTNSKGGSNSWVYILLFGGGAIAIVVGIAIISVVILYLRKKYIYTRVQPDDFIDDEEFPM